jgi:hypothetical protein
LWVRIPIKQLVTGSVAIFFLIFATKDLSQQAFYQGTLKPALSSAKKAQFC